MTTKLARADTIESRVEFEAGPAANNPGPRAVLRQHAPSATRQRTLEANGSTAGPVPVLEAVVERRPRVLPDRAGGDDAREPRRCGNPLAGTRQGPSAAWPSMRMTNSPGVRERALLTRPRQARLRARRLDRIVGRVRARDREGGFPWQTRRRRSVAAAKTRKRARRQRPSARARRRLSRPRLSGMSRPRIHAMPTAAPVWTARWGRHRQQQPTVAVTRFASASTSRAVTSSGRDPMVLGGMLRAERPDRLRSPLAVQALVQRRRDR
jgi:hypothetical protein